MSDPDGAADTGPRRDLPPLALWQPSGTRALALASCRYRLGNLAELHPRAELVLDDALPSPVRGRCRAVIASRPYVDAACRRELDRCQRQGVLRIADFDDLLFAGEAVDYPRVRSGQISAERYLSQQHVYRDGLACFDAFTAATRPLAEAIERARPGAPAFVVPNGLSARWVRQGRLASRPWQPGEPRVIRYLAGSPTHDADFAVVAGVLQGFLADRPEVRLQTLGPLRFDHDGFPADRVECLPAVPFDHLPELLASAWVCIAPLAASDFTAAKSAIKFLEAAAFGCPTIATPNADMVEHAGGGVLLAEGAEQWRGHLDALMDDETRLSLGERVRVHVETKGMADRSLSALGRALASLGVTDGAQTTP